MQFIKNNLLTLIILVLAVIIALQRCGGGSPSEAVKVIRDTTWVVKDSLIFSKPQVIKTIQVTSHDTIINHYVPDTNYQKLVVQYQEVVKELLAKNIQEDSINVNSYGFVKITDTIQKNVIVGRKSEVNVKCPIIRETYMMPAQPVNQLYIGGGLSGSRVSLINSVKTGVLFKNKKDQIYGASIGLNTNGQVVYGVESFWKIKLK
jgi:hypothetical protein